MSSLPGSLPLSQANLTKSQNEFKIVLKELEDSLLARLSAASGNFLGDTALVENLETTKHTASEIEEKVRNRLGDPPPHTPSQCPQRAWQVGRWSLRREATASPGPQDRVGDTDAHQARHLHLLMGIQVISVS